VSVPLVSEIIASGTAIVLGCFWLSAQVVRHAFEPEAKPTPPPPVPERVWPFQTHYDACQLCGQKQYALGRSARGHLLVFACPQCGGRYLTKPAVEACP
jgi:DNA-directed RNA polymerase subunit RPC12/RpoP